jgi:hypothetical protein
VKIFPKNRQTCAAGTPPLFKQDSQGIKRLAPRGPRGPFRDPQNSGPKFRLFFMPDSESRRKMDHFSLTMSSADPPPSTLKTGLKSADFHQKIPPKQLFSKKIQTCSFPVHQGVLHPKKIRRPNIGHFGVMKIPVV